MSQSSLCRVLTEIGLMATLLLMVVSLLVGEVVRTSRGVARGEVLMLVLAVPQGMGIGSAAEVKLELWRVGEAWVGSLASWG